MTITPNRYIAPTAWGDIVFMKTVRWLTERGISLLGSRVLTVRGRTTGTARSVPVNLLKLDGERYLVAPAATPNGFATSARRARPSCG